jgi:muramoyltetrapeptide carboxypeptidase
MYKIKSGDKVALIAPSAQIGNFDKISAGVAYLRSLGLIPVFGKNLYNRIRYMAGSEEERAFDVNSAFADSEISAVFCVRAAAGASNMLPYVDYDLIKKHPKPLIGFCDNAALMLALHKKSAIISYNGFLPTYDFKDGTINPLVRSSLENLLSGHTQTIKSGITLRNGKAEGVLICSNLSVLLYLAGTPYFPDLSDKILLLEDTHEKVYKIDLMLQHLKQQPDFAKVKGVIFGQFTDCPTDSEDGSVADCIYHFMQDTDFPVIKDFAFGHQPARYVLPLGAKVRLDAENTSLEILSY